MKVKTSELSGKALDWATGKASGINVGINIEGHVKQIESYQPITMHPWRPSTDWRQCGEILDRFDVDVSPQYPGYFASAKFGVRSFGETRKIAICRAVVSAKLGDEVEIPDELMEVK